MSNYPVHVHQQLERARVLGKTYCGQADAAAICFDVLADFPDCKEASETIYELFCDEWLIYDNRIALQRLIEEWDDQPHQHRRRLALSFGFMSRYEAWHEDEIGETETDSLLAGTESRTVIRYLQQGKMQLLEAYCMGDEEATDYAWDRMMQAIDDSHDPQNVKLLVAKQYAELGFFADATDLLLEVCSAQDNSLARRLLAETRWWRDNAHRVPWIPPPGDGSRYNRLIKLIDPKAPTMQETIAQMRERMRQVGYSPSWQPIIDPALAQQFKEVLPQEPETPETPAPTLVDWSFLDREDGSSTEIAAWVYKDIETHGKQLKNFEADSLKRHKLTRPIPPPTIPKNYDLSFAALSDDEMDLFEDEDEAWADDEDLLDDDDDLSALL